MDLVLAGVSALVLIMLMRQNYRIQVGAALLEADWDMRSQIRDRV